jgi:bacillolysin
VHEFGRTPLGSPVARTSIRPFRQAGLVGLLAVGLIATMAAPGPSARGSDFPRSPVAASAETTLAGELRAAGRGGTTIGTDPATGAVSFVGFPAGTAWRSAATADPAAVVHAFVGRYATLFGARSSDLRPQRPLPTPQGGSLIRLAQRYRSIPVAGAELVVQLDPAGGVVTAAGRLVPTPNLDLHPKVAPSQARATARTSAARNWGIEPVQIRTGRPVVSVYDPALQGQATSSRPVLTWRVPVSASTRAPHSGVVFLDARSGHALAALEHVHTELARIVCDNANSSTGPATCSGDRAVRLEGGANAIGAQAQSAYAFMGDIYGFLRTRFGRDGIDGLGRTMKSVVRYCRPGNCPYANAYWDGEDTMVFGEGFVVDDVAFHELAHGLTQYTSRLVYLGESGAINESMSDAFGEFLDLLTPGDGSDDTRFPWLLGEGLDVLGGALRSMADPPASRVAQPDSILSPKFLRFPLSTSCGVGNDFCGVHRNSGVGNKAAFLIAAGGTFNGQSVTGLGVEKAAALYFQVENLLGPTSRYRDLAGALRQGCANLVGTTPVGASSVTLADCAQVDRAVRATEMDAGGTANQPPRAPDRTLDVPKNGSAKINVLTGASDPDGDAVYFGTATDGLRGRVSCTPKGTCTYAPDTGAGGQDAFTYTVRDGRGGTASATVRVTIRPASATTTSGKAKAHKAKPKKARSKAATARGNEVRLGSGAGRDEVTLARAGGTRYAIRGVLRAGDIEVVRRDGSIRSIVGEGWLSPTLSVVFDLTVRKGKAFGVIRVRESTQGISDRIRLDGVRISASGRTVGATVRWHKRGTARTLIWVLRDLHR